MVVIFSLTLKKFKPLTANPATIATIRLIRINMVPLIELNFAVLKINTPARSVNASLDTKDTRNKGRSFRQNASDRDVHAAWGWLRETSENAWPEDAFGHEAA